ncbi:MAG: efflux RND transporter periplasmic adaptor subunit [Halieaceae bacterium]|uniref:efflux RND transporter periplasmic adaptor subunit n=1 Tax=Haliea alexandrii TaxID=2448162 RepID=UPI001304B921|nr:efflux RND transporter periplasmic adaptor subunit [Haliea alexandrii]MCR9183907.1 efflux RND transporter periplasmic adaptor subunit [Halieaceae bacterium]
MVTNPKRRSIEYTLTALGSVESIHNPTISAETSGRIVSIEVSEGQSIASQQLLATIDGTLHSIEADKAAGELKRQRVLVENQQREVEHLQRLAKSQSVSKDQLDDEQSQLEMLSAMLEVARKQSQQALHLESKTKVTAPREGLIAKRHISRGDYVTPGQPLFDLVSVSKLQARLAFPEHHAARIHVGKHVRLESPASPATAAVGMVTSVNPRINPMSRALNVLVEFDNPGGWYPGASVDATMILERRHDALTIPLISVVRRDHGDAVFVVEGGHANQQPVKLGWREETWVEVLEGLEERDQVVTEGSALISDGSLLSITPKNSAR